MATCRAAAGLQRSSPGPQASPNTTSDDLCVALPSTRRRLRVTRVPGRGARVHPGRGQLLSRCQAAADEAITEKVERGCAFTVGEAFYREDSSQARDLAILAAGILGREAGRPLRVLDCCSGSGSRGARYLQQAPVSFVWCNDYDPSTEPLLISNLVGSTATSQGNCSGAQEFETVSLDGLRGTVTEGRHCPDNSRPVAMENEEERDQRRWRVSHFEAVRLLGQCWLTEDYYDLVDVDPFGSAGRFTAAALGAVKDGGLLYLTCTDGLAASGRTPHIALRQYGTYTAPVPFANEQGLRMLIGSAVMEGFRRRQSVEPLFSLFSPHGPVYRVMLRVRCRPDFEAAEKSIGFIAHFPETGHSEVIPFERLGTLRGSASAGTAPPGLRGDGAATLESSTMAEPMVCGPMWTGPLHCQKMVKNMQAEAEARGWRGLSTDLSKNATGGSPKHKRWSLEEILEIMHEEGDPRLRPGYLTVSDVSRLGRLQGTPGCGKLIAALREEGYAAARCHLTTRGFHTSATMDQVIEVARTRFQCRAAANPARVAQPHNIRERLRRAWRRAMALLSEPLA